MKKDNRYFIYASGIVLGLAFFLIFLSRQLPAFSSFYGRNIFPYFVTTIGRVFGLVPFSVFEILIILAGLALLYGIFRLVKNPRSWPKLLLVLSVLLLFFTLTAGINYSRPELLGQLIEENSRTHKQEHSQEDLIALFHILVDDLTGLENQVARDENGLLLPGQMDARESMRNLSSRFPDLAGYYPRTKPVLFSKAMTYLGITGIYSPFTLEANYNKHVPSYIIPFTLCHELAHLKGFMREEEANFIAYLACRDSSSLEFQYSGGVNALSYTLNALYRTLDPDLYQDLLLEIPESVRKEIANNRAYWQKHRRKVTELANKANDTYLKANAQTHGVKSYGMMVELLLEEYRNEKD